jgi:NRPS condensation-like uncharacterized protein
MKLEFPLHIKKKTQISNFITFEAAVFNVDKWTDMPKSSTTFQNFENSIKNTQIIDI